MIKCCIVGGAGFIGQYLLSELSKTNREILVVGRQKKRPLVLSPEVKYLSNTRNFPWKQALSGFDELVWLAYTTYPKSSFDNPLADVAGNLVPAVFLFESLIQTPIKKVVLVSSGGTIYGEARKLPISEQHSTNPISPYGVTKLAIEKYALMYHWTHHLPVVIVRPSTCYGPGQRPYRGQGLVATAMASILSGTELPVFGTTKTIRDYIFVTDVARGIHLALENGEIGQSYNLGTGIGTSNLALIKKISGLSARLGIKPKLKLLPARPFDVGINALNSARFRKTTGWKPQISLDHGLALTWDWFIKHH